MRRKLSIFLAAIIGASVPLHALAQLGQPIEGFRKSEVRLCETPKKSKRSASSCKTKVSSTSLGTVSEILISAYYPANGLVGLSLPDGRYVIVEYRNVKPLNRSEVDQKMGTDVPPGTCLSALNVRVGSKDGSRSGARRGFGGC